MPLWQPRSLSENKSLAKADYPRGVFSQAFARLEDTALDPISNWHCDCIGCSMKRVLTLAMPNKAFRHGKSQQGGVLCGGGRRMGADVIRALFLPACRTEKRAAWEPAVDLYRLPHGWLIKLDLAGVSSDDVEIHLAGRCVVVRGVRRDCSHFAGLECYCMEIAYSQFERV